MYIIQCRNYMANFNPHFRKGSDAISTPTITISNHISIHTSAREVTKAVHTPMRYQYISIHTSAREVTSPGHHVRERTDISIHTSAREVTASVGEAVADEAISIHTSAREVTAIFHKNICLFL